MTEGYLNYLEHEGLHHAQPEVSADEHLHEPSDEVSNEEPVHLVHHVCKNTIHIIWCVDLTVVGEVLRGGVED